MSNERRYTFTVALLGRARVHCTPSGGPSAAATAWDIALVALCIVCPRSCVRAATGQRR